MKKEEWNEGLNYLDEGIVEAYFKEKEVLAARKTQRKFLLRFGGLAACIILIVSAILFGPLILNNGQGFLPGGSGGTNNSPGSNNSSRPGNSEESNGSFDNNDSPKPGDSNNNASPPESDDGCGEKEEGMPGMPSQNGDLGIPVKDLTGKQELFFGSAGESTTSGDKIPEGFYLDTIVEVRVVAVSDDVFYVPGYDIRYRVARLKIVDLIRGSGHPEEIFLRFPYYSSDVFNGYDSFIMSLTQVGVENYLMLNETEAELSYFPNMFEVTCVNDLGYGSVIAFNNGAIDTSFFDRVTHFNNRENLSSMLDTPQKYDYPAGRYSTLNEVKENIGSLVSKWDEENYREYAIKPFYDYYTAEDIFVSEEAKEVQRYINSKENDFTQIIAINNDRVVAIFERLINGFPTKEIITVNGYTGNVGNVVGNGVNYSREDVISAPDIGKAIANINLNELVPPHVSESEKDAYKFVNVKGFYRLINGETYGIVRVVWFFPYPVEDLNGYHVDHMYIMFDKNGNASTIEKDALKELIGKDTIVDGLGSYYYYERW